MYGLGRGGLFQRLLLSALCVALSLSSACSARGPAPAVFDHWYRNAEPGSRTDEGLWKLLTRRRTDLQGEHWVHLRRVEPRGLHAGLYRDGNCVGRLTLEGRWDGQRFVHRETRFAGLPPLAWGRTSDELALQMLDATALAVDLHASSFGMFLFIVGGAPERNSRHHFEAGPAPGIRLPCN